VTDSFPAAGDSTITFRFLHALLLHEAGHLDEAKSAYLAILTLDSTHLDTLTYLGALLRDANYLTAAATVFHRIIAHHPRETAGHVGLANVLVDRGDFAAARPHYEAALALDSNCALAHQGLAVVLMELREEESAWIHGRKGFAGRSYPSNPYRGRGTPVSLLVLNSVAGGNIPLRKTIDDRVFLTTMLVTEFHDPVVPLPSHQVVLNAIGDADYCREGLRSAMAMVEKTNAPILNPPQAVARTGRAENARRFAEIGGVVTPKMAVLPRETLAKSEVFDDLQARGFQFPLLLRALGFQAGKHFVKVERPDGLATALSNLPGRQFAVVQFLDARSSDGKIRKYRVMMIDGKLYPLHAAVSSHWKIHYFSADMAERPEHRAEDEAFLLDMPRILGHAAVAALDRVRVALGLDYAGVDFSLNSAGDVLLFEANATMVVLPPEPGDKWAYRRPPVQRVLDAVTAMLLSRIETVP
jgi:glutathione synthase/RimK-type ligase-like ATP-grasp enzyme